MRAVNNIIVTAGDPVCRFQKTVAYSVSGRRLDPHDESKSMEFILGQRPYEAEPDYDSQVIEIYSERELKFFQFNNRYLFARGLLAPYSEAPLQVDTTNSVSDEEVDEIASTRSFAEFTKKLTMFDSRITIKRIKDAAVKLDRPMRFVSAAENYENGLK